MRGFLPHLRRAAQIRRAPLLALQVLPAVADRLPLKGHMAFSHHEGAVVLLLAELLAVGEVRGV